MKPHKRSIDEKRILLETRNADGEVLRREIRKQIEMSKILRHEYAEGYRIGVETWFEGTALVLEEVFDTKRIAEKFRNIYPYEIGDFESPRVKLVDTRTDIEKLEALDRKVKRGIKRLDEILSEFIRLHPKQDSLILRLLKNGSLIIVFLGLVAWVIFKLTGIDLRGWIWMK